MRLVINGDEEIGSPFSRPLIEDAVRDADAVLVFEGSVDGAVKTARKGVGLFEVHATGIEAHAGLDPEAGASAIGEIARVVTTLHDASDLGGGHDDQRRCAARRAARQRRRRGRGGAPRHPRGHS